MPKILTLRPPQLPMLEFLKEHERCALWAGMGIGKSSATLFLLVLLKLLGKIGDAPTLVIGPMRVARDTWPEEAAKWAQFSHLVITPLTGCDEAERIRRLRRRSDIFTISYELLPWLVDYYMERWPFRQVVADESDRLKGFRMSKGGKRAHSIGRVAHTLVKRWINLTGTPAANGYLDLWGQTWFLDRGYRLGLTYSAYKDRWFRTNEYTGKTELMPFSQQQINELLKDICLTVDPKDYFDLHEPIVTPVVVHLPKPARKIYRELEKDLFSKLATGEKIEVFNKAAMTNKCLQLANGAVYTDYPKWQGIHDEKIEALQSIEAESNAPLLVAYSFKSDVARLKSAFPKAVDLSTSGGTAAFRAGDAAIGLAHPKSMGHGIDGLQHVTNILVRFGHSWPPGERRQMLERIGPMRQFQAGLDRAVLVYDIIADNTLDEEVIESHTTKCGIERALLNAMKRRG